MNNELYVNSIESFSTKDGEGIRSVVFLQGCNLRCPYCHNPETWEIKCGEKIPVNELAERLLRFKDYWGNKGGVTISGGEPLLQSKSLIELVKLFKACGVNVAIDTSGSVINKDAREVIRLCDLVILDFKDPKTVISFLGETERADKRVWIRIVIVPGINDTEKNIDEYASLLKDQKIEKVELVPFHTLGFEKYEKMGIVNPLAGTRACSTTRIRELQSRFNSIFK